mgnify:FL=1
MCKTFEFYADAAKASGERAGLVTVEHTVNGQRVIELHEPDLWAKRRQLEAERAAERAEAQRSQRQLSDCLDGWHNLFEKVPGLLERMEAS